MRIEIDSNCSKVAPCTIINGGDGTNERSVRHHMSELFTNLVHESGWEWNTICVRTKFASWRVWGRIREEEEGWVLEPICQGDEEYGALRELSQRWELPKNLFAESCLSDDVFYVVMTVAP